MLETFIYEALPGRVVFGVDVLPSVVAEAERLGIKRALVLTTPEQSAQGKMLAGLLEDRFAGLLPLAKMHTPVEVTEAAVAAAKKVGADGLVSLGGGSTTGLGKAIALRTGLPQIAVPTTYAGSEVTPILGETVGGLKTTIRNTKILPAVVIYDVSLTLGLPVALSVTSGLNAIAHAVEALYARDRNPIISLMAERGVEALASALPRIVADPTSVAARSDALYGAWLCGVCLGAVGMALHHKLCHTLGGAFDLPHAETHAVILPHALAFNLPAAPQAHEALSRALGASQPAEALQNLAHELKAPTSLEALGMPQAGIAAAADMAIQSPYWNPRPFDRSGIAALLARAWAGDTPQP